MRDIGRYIYLAFQKGFKKILDWRPIFHNDCTATDFPLATDCPLEKIGDRLSATDRPATDCPSANPLLLFIKNANILIGTLLLTKLIIFSDN